MAMMGWGLGFGGFGMLFMGIFWLILLGVVAWAIVAAVSRGDRGRSGEVRERQSSAVDIARARYARGEISKAEYEQLLSDLSR